MGKIYIAPTDFSEGCNVALAHATDQAKQTGAELHLVHVVQPAVYPAGIDTSQAAFVNLERDLTEGAEKRLKESVAQLEGQGIKASYKILRGKPSTEIIDYAEDAKADLIFISTHGSGGIEHFLFGSTTEKVLRKAKCPVFVVRNRQ
jgi:nucleotide-binding universal stress UspA family protein